MKIKFLILLVALFVAFGSTGYAQKKKPKTPAAAPAFDGAPDQDFKAFVIKNIGKRVSLKLTFTEDNMPYGYRSGDADPVFSVDNYSYFLPCGEKATGEWTARCEKLNWDNDSKSFSGFFKITEPDPRTMRTNRSFQITPVK